MRTLEEDRQEWDKCLVSTVLELHSKTELQHSAERRLKQLRLDLNHNNIKWLQTARPFTYTVSSRRSDLRSVGDVFSAADCDHSRRADGDVWCFSGLNQVSAASAVQQNSATLFDCEAPELFCVTWLSNVITRVWAVCRCVRRRKHSESSLFF